MTVTLLLLAHGLAAVFLLGAVTHQTIAVIGNGPAPGAGFFRRLSAVNAATYADAVIIMYVIVVVGGGLIYPTYVIDVKASLNDAGMSSAIGAFEIKEHFAVFGLALLPGYAVAWRAGGDSTGRKLTTTVLAAIVWWNFVVGHVLNNIKGL